MGADFGGVWVLADFKGKIRQSFPNCPFQIVASVGFVEADIVGAAQRLVGE